MRHMGAIYYICGSAGRRSIVTGITHQLNRSVYYTIVQFVSLQNPVAPSRTRISVHGMMWRLKTPPPASGLSSPCSMCRGTQARLECCDRGERVHSSCCCIGVVGRRCCCTTTVSSAGFEWSEIPAPICFNSNHFQLMTFTASHFMVVLHSGFVASYYNASFTLIQALQPIQSLLRLWMKRTRVSVS